MSNFPNFKYFKKKTNNVNGNESVSISMTNW